MIVQVRWRRGTSNEWVAANPRLAAGEPGFDTTLARFKIGDGIKVWADLPYASVSALELQAALARIDQAVIDARAARDAAIAAGGGGTGTGGGTLIVDTTDPGTFVIPTGSTLVPDTTDPGTFVTTSTA